MLCRICSQNGNPLFISFPKNLVLQFSFFKATVIKGHCIKYAGIPVFCPSNGECGSVKTSILVNLVSRAASF